MSGTGIEYVDRVWPATWGCSGKVSTGCKECWAEHFARRQGRDFRRVQLASHKELWAPRRWRLRGTVFVSPMGDLFDPAVPDDHIRRVFQSMGKAPRQRFLVLTKRSSTMKGLMELWKDQYWARLSNVALGVSVEDQATADERLADLLATRCKLRWVSYEPALGPVDFGPWLPGHQLPSVSMGRYPALDWIVIGGESARPQSRARPVNVECFYKTFYACRRAGVPIYVKQMGSAYALSHRLRDPRGGTPAEWAPALRVREPLRWPTLGDQ